MSDLFSWEWWCSLFPSESTDEIDPYTWTCIHCGFKWKFNKLQLLKMFLTGELIHTCPQCLRKSKYRMVSHVARDIDTEEIKEHNRWLD